MTYTGKMVLPRNAVTMQEDEMRNVEGGGPLSRIIYWGVKASHYNAHRSYTTTSTRQGKKYKVTYKAIPRSKCYLCKAMKAYNSY